MKKQGNQSVHSVKVNPDEITALECLQRAFEIAINYAVYYTKTSSSLCVKYDNKFSSSDSVFAVSFLNDC